MKKIRPLIIAFTVILCFSPLLTSCKKDENEDDGKTGSDGNSEIREEEEDDLSGNPDDRSKGDPYENDKDWF